MAQRLGVTKGAVSQTLSRLEGKGILTKNKDPYLKNKLTVDFTELGQAAMRNHRLHAQALQNEYQYYLSTLTEKDKDVIRRFLARIEAFVDRIG
jgi:DNA-binding MarR family transcriptional regulator